jgi:tetraacyldisaccharide 4'-kinase
MPPPEFWRHRGLAAIALSPLGALVSHLGPLWRARTTPTVVGVPVICVGNLTVGGAGKTPLVIALARALQGLGRAPHILSRGYGGRLKGPLRVDPVQHEAQDVGDEPLLLARMAPTWICADRATSARAAVEDGADILLMDDGFQNPGLIKTVSILVIDGGYGFGNGQVMPAGPLREALAGGLARADAAVIIGDDITGIRDAIADRCPIFDARIVPIPDQGITGKPVIAFAGIGRPEKFYASLQELGCTLIETRNFADHHPYTPDEIMRLCDLAHALDATLVTTEKDLVRLPDAARKMVQALRIAVEWSDPATPGHLLRKALGNG